MGLMLVLSMSFVMAAGNGNQAMLFSDGENHSDDMAIDKAMHMNQTQVRERVVLNQSEFAKLNAGGEVLTPEQGFGNRLMNTFQLKNTIKVAEKAKFLGVFNVERTANYEVGSLGELTRQRTVWDYFFKGE